MAQDITKDVIGCKEIELQKVNQSTKPVEFFGTITNANHLVTKSYVDSKVGISDILLKGGKIITLGGVNVTFPLT